MALGKRRLKEITSDTRLTTEARIAVIHVALHGGDDWLEVSHAEWRRLLGHPGQKKLTQILRDAADLYLDTKAGGRGHSDSYRFRSADSATLNANSPAESATLNEPTEPDRSAESAALTLRVAENATLKFRSADSATLNAPRTRDDVVSQLEREKGSNTPSIVSPTKSIDSEADDAIVQHDGILNGCRGALRDYLAVRVPAGRQFGYVQRVATMLGGHGFNWNPLGADKGVAPPARPGLVAAALNELLATGERDAEQPMKWPDGDPRNLATKLEILIKQSQRGDHDHQHQRTGAEAKGRGQAPGRINELAHLG